MTTIGLRGVLAGAFIVSTGLLTGMASMSSGAAASESVSARSGTPEAVQPGLFDRIKLKACQVSLAARPSDRSASRDRSRECGE